MSSDHFTTRHDETGREYVESDMQCQISNVASQLLTFYKITTTGWKSMDEPKTPLQLKGTNPPPYSGWFPMNPVIWCTDVFGLFGEHEYSKFLAPTELIYNNPDN
jgi:hypothetical protein